jgi:hypothetical protein
MSIGFQSPCLIENHLHISELKYQPPPLLLFKMGESRAGVNFHTGLFMDCKIILGQVAQSGIDHFGRSTQVPQA